MLALDFIAVWALPVQALWTTWSSCKPLHWQACARFCIWPSAARTQQANYMLLFFLTYNVFGNQIIAQPFKLHRQCFSLALFLKYGAKTTSSKTQTLRRRMFFCVSVCRIQATCLAGRRSRRWRTKTGIDERRKNNNYWKPSTQNSSWPHF